MNTYIVFFDREAPVVPARVEEAVPSRLDEDIAYYSKRYNTEHFGVRLDTFAPNGAVLSSVVLR